MSLKSPMEFFRTLPKKRALNAVKRWRSRLNLTLWNVSAVFPKRRVSKLFYNNACKGVGRHENRGEENSDNRIDESAV